MVDSLWIEGNVVMRCHLSCQVELLLTSETVRIRWDWEDSGICANHINTSSDSRSDRLGKRIDNRGLLCITRCNCKILRV